MSRRRPDLQVQARCIERDGLTTPIEDPKGAKTPEKKNAAEPYCQDGGSPLILVLGVQ